MAVILDTNALSAFADGDRQIRRALQGEPDILIPAVVIGEYLFGIRQSRFCSEYERWLATNPGAFGELPIQSTTAHHYAEIRKELKNSGRPIPTNDLWIASLAREHSAPVVTEDKHFTYVSGLHIIGYR